MKCEYCGSENVMRNRVRTLFCRDCHICVGRSGIPQRMVSHPDYTFRNWKFKNGEEPKKLCEALKEKG